MRDVVDLDADEYVGVRCDGMPGCTTSTCDEGGCAFDLLTGQCRVCGCHETRFDDSQRPVGVE